MIVTDVAHVPWHLQLAACFVGARVQLNLLRPLLQCLPMKPVTLVFTRAFSKKHFLVVGVAHEIQRRGKFPGRKGRTVVRKKIDVFLSAWEAASAKEKRSFTLVYDEDDDEEVKRLTPSQLGVARSFPEFLRSFTGTQPVAME